MSTDTRAAARAFVRSLNILLKFARLYEFGHARTGAQFETAWKELKMALEESSGSGLLLGASGNQILLDGVPLGAAAGEKSFAQLLASSGIASIHFGTTTSQPQFARFVRGFLRGTFSEASVEPTWSTGPWSWLAFSPLYHEKPVQTTIPAERHEGDRRKAQGP